MVVIFSFIAMMAFDFDDENTKISLAFTGTLLFALTVYRWFQQRNYPPGPLGLPVVGYYPFLGKDPSVTLQKLGEKYGKIFSVKVMQTHCIVINDYDLAKEILNHPLTLARPAAFTVLLPDNAGFVGKSGAEWQEQRRFCVLTMKNLGLGRGIWEKMIQEDVVDFVKEIKKYGGKPFDLNGPLSLSQAENNVALLIGKKFGKDRSNPEIKIIEDTVPILLQALSGVDIISTSPLITKLMFTLNLGTLGKIKKLVAKFECIFRNEVTRRIKSPEEAPKDDFIGHYLQEIESQKILNKKNFMSVDNLVGTMMALFTAGYDSTMSSINWLILLMASYPEVQKKVHEEIDEVIGRDGIVYWDHRPKLPYTMATMMEMERFTPVVGIFPPRQVLESFEFNGYTIPKGSSVITNGYALMMDSKYHKNSDTFQPERFLKNDGKEVAKIEGYIPFSFGKRSCPGEIVALMSMFLYFTTLMQKFLVTPPPGKKCDFTPVFGAVVHPRHQELCVIAR